jgi:hypothetical protein
MPAPIGLENTPRYAEMVRRVFGDTELVPPGFQIESDRAEWAIFKHEYLWIRRFVVGPVVAVRSGVGIRNQFSDRVMVIQQIFNNSGSALFVFDLTTAPDPANYTNAQGTMFSRDSRSADSLVNILSRILGAGLTAEGVIHSFTTVSSNLLITDLVLGLNGRITFEPNADNVGVDVTLVGYTRPTTAEERSD